MRLELFPTIVHQEKLRSHAQYAGACLTYLDDVFARCEQDGVSHPLEVGPSLSTFATDRTLFKEAAFTRIADEVVERVAALTGFKAEFIEMWANRHRRNSMTLEHLHGTQICGVYYLKYPANSGRLIFRSPLEYAVCGCPQVDVVDWTMPDRSLHYMDIEPGDLSLFPGWLKHMTEPSRSNEDRVVVSFNMRIVGLIMPQLKSSIDSTGDASASSTS